MVLLRQDAVLKKILVLGIVLALHLVPGLAGRAWAQKGAGEYDVKAAFLYNFAKFVEWPDDSFESPGTPVTLCVLGKDPFGDSLDNVVRGETLNGRPLNVHRTRDLLEVRDCHVVFIAREERGRQEEVIQRVRGAGVLTVGEADGFLDDGGIIRFVLDQNRVRFEVNLDAAERNRLKLSSKLLRLARSVIQQPGQQGQGR